MSGKQREQRQTKKRAADSSLEEFAPKISALDQVTKSELEEVKGELECGFPLSTQLTDPSWCKSLSTDMNEPYFQEIEVKLAEAYRKGSKICPSPHLIFHAFNLTPLDKVKVVIVGQDPYHDNQAMGLAFSVPMESKVPPTLRNIYKELENDIPGFVAPTHGCLESWALQGVFLMNATLTVESHKPNSHKSLGWQKFTDRVIQIISEQRDKVVFLLWGNFAHKKEKLIDPKKHMIVKTAHPSPLGLGKFFDSKCFSQANSMLEKSGLTPIDWKL